MNNIHIQLQPLPPEDGGDGTQYRMLVSGADTALEIIQTPTGEGCPECLGFVRFQSDVRPCGSCGVGTTDPDRILSFSQTAWVRNRIQIARIKGWEWKRADGTWMLENVG